MEPNLEADEVLPARMLDQAREVALRNKQFPVPLKALLATKKSGRRKVQRDAGLTSYGPGFPVTPTGFGPSPYDPARASQVMNSVLGPFVRELALAKLRTQWDDIVGSDIAAHCQVEKVDKETVVVRASSTAWATQLRKLSYLMLQKIQGKIGSQVIDDIKILGPIVPSWKMGALSVPGRGPRDTYG
ncbi:hypothetical protein BM477_00920 [Boudabousia marimammalium]|uniref:RNA-binding protein n=2 Tax=Boudabousia marimammalium TaxID=156892 RepID=A0A1Q5PSS1_9ACTO|nr:hypothetical protein BM477_00920 [Boudabousia marimammalium]